MKRLLALLLTLITLVTLVSCKDPYPPVKSTEEEARTAMTMTYGGKTYTVPYELYRTFLLTLREEVGGEDADWSDATLREELHARVTDRILQIVSVYALCDELKIDLYDRDTDELVKDYIKQSVEGDDLYDGYGSYDAFLAALKENFANYSVADRLFRYAIGQDRMYTHYIGSYNSMVDAYEGGALAPTDAELDVFYEDESTAQVMLIYLSHQVYDRSEAELLRATLLAKAGNPDDVAEWLLRHTATAQSVANGELVTPYTLDPIAYAEVTEAALSLEAHSFSTLIDVTGEDADGYYLVYRMQKSDTYREANADHILESYQLHTIGKKLADISTALDSTRIDADFLATLDIASVSME